MHRATLLLATSLALAGACSKKSDDKGSAAASGSSAAAPPGSAETKPPLTAAWLGKPASLPGQLAPLRPGMTKEEAEAASPLATQPGTQASELDGVTYAVQHGNEGADLLVYLPADKVSVVTEAWGPGHKVARGGKPITVWFDPEQGVRAALDEGDRPNLRFEAYTPLAKLLGEGKDIAVLDKPFQGKSLDEIKALYPHLVGSTGHLTLPATEWEFGSGTSLSPYPMSGNVESLAFTIPFVLPEHEAEIKKTIEAKWGAPKEEIKFGSVAGEKTFVYNKQDPRIQVTEPGGYNKGEYRIRIGGKG